MTKITTFGGNVGKAFITALVAFLGIYGAQIIATLPKSITEMTIGGVLTFIVAYITHATATPAGSTVIKPQV